MGAYHVGAIADAAGLARCRAVGPAARGAGRVSATGRAAVANLAAGLACCRDAVASLSRSLRVKLADQLPNARAGVGGRNQLATHPLRQGADSCHTQLRAHPGHKPIKSLWAQASEHLNGHLYADAVVEPARLKNVRKRQGQVTLMPSVGVAVKVVALGKQQFTGEIQQLGGVLTLMLPPVVESRRAGDFLR